MSELKLNFLPGLIKALLLPLCLLLHGQVMAEDVPTVNQEETLLIGYVEAPGYISREENGTLSGVVFDYMHTVANYANVKIRFTPCTPEECDRMLQNGRIDVYTNIMASEDERRNNVFRDYSAHPITKSMIYLSKKDTAGVSSIFGDAWRLGFDETTLNRESIIKALERDNLEEGRDYSLLPYTDSAKMYEDYDSGNLDGVTVDSAHSDERVNLKSSMFFAETFFAVKKGNTALLDRLNVAADRLNLDDPLYSDFLFRKHLSYQQMVLLTPEEQAYLQGHPSFKIYATPSQPPYSYFEHGQAKGVIHDIMALIADSINVKFIYQDTRTKGEMLRRFNKGEPDLLADLYSDYNWAQENNARITFPYLTLNYVGVVRRDEELPENPRVACLRGNYLVRDKIEDEYEPDQLVYFASEQECLNAVNDGRADITYVDTISADSFLASGGYYKLHAIGNISFTHDLSMALAKNTDQLMLSILNKVIVHLDPVVIQAIIARQSDYVAPVDKTVIGYIYFKPLKVILAVAGVLLAVIAYLLYCLFRRKFAMRKVWRTAYTDRHWSVHNRTWFERYAPRRIRDYREEYENGRLFIMTISIAQMSLLRDSRDQTFIKNLERMLASTQQKNPWILEVCSSYTKSRLFALCRLPWGLKLKEAIEQLIRDASVYRMEGYNIHLDYCIGACTIDPKVKLNIPELMSFAIIAQMDASRHDKAVGIYDEEQKEKLLWQKKVEQYMQKGLMNNEFKVWLQPKYNILTQKTVGAEALVRWDSPDLGFMTPDKFIELFEHNNFVFQLDYYMLEQICKLQRYRSEHGMREIPISVNQSGLHISEEGYLHKMREITNTYKLPHNLIELEITETAFIDFSTKTARTEARMVIDGLKELKYDLSMDDFCTGYSSLALLQNFPMETMKIDRSLLEHAPSSPRAEQVLRSIIGFGRDLGMKVICEGVETREQEELLVRNGCTIAQGYLFSKPMPAGEFNDFVMAH